MFLAWKLRHAKLLCEWPCYGDQSRLYNVSLAFYWIYHTVWFRYFQNATVDDKAHNFSCKCLFVAYTKDWTDPVDHASFPHKNQLYYIGTLIIAVARKGVRLGIKGRHCIVFLSKTLYLSSALYWFNPGLEGQENVLTWLKKLLTGM